MTATFVVDASVVVEFLAPGEMGDEADRFMDGLTRHDPIALVAPDLLFLEAASALGRLERRGHLSAQGADRAVARLPALPIGSVPAGMLVEQAWTLRKNITVYDAAYLVLAGALDVPLVTADRRLAKATERIAVTAVTLGDPELTEMLGA